MTSDDSDDPAFIERCMLGGASVHAWVPIPDNVYANFYVPLQINRGVSIFNARVDQTTQPPTRQPTRRVERFLVPLVLENKLARDPAEAIVTYDLEGKLAPVRETFLGGAPHESSPIVTMFWATMQRHRSDEQEATAPASPDISTKPGTVSRPKLPPLQMRPFVERGFQVRQNEMTNVWSPFRIVPYLDSGTLVLYPTASGFEKRLVVYMAQSLFPDQPDYVVSVRLAGRAADGDLLRTDIVPSVRFANADGELVTPS